MKKIIFATLFFFPTITFATYYDDGYGMMGSLGWGWGGIWGLGMMLFMVFFWVLFALGIAYIVRMLFGHHNDERKSQNKSIEILKERYAKGEIDKKEFEEIKKDLS